MIPPQAMKALNIFLILVPIICFGVQVGNLYGKYRHIGQLRTEQVGLDRQIGVADRALASDANMPTYKQQPTAEQSAAEQARFLDQLHGEARSTGVQITTWTNALTAAAPTPSASSTADTSAAAATHVLPLGINSITSQVEVVGTFQGLRQFLYHLERTPRLLNLSNPHWVRADWPRTRLSFMLTRYVTPEAAPIQTTVGRVAEAPRSPVGTRPGS
jgi:hypothetical protein